MFLSVPRNERREARALMPRGWRTWRVLSLAISWPWFVMSTSEESDGTTTQHDRLVGTSDSLRELLIQPGSIPTHLSVALPPQPGLRPAWQFRAIRKVWAQPDPFHASGETLLFEDFDGRTFTVEGPQVKVSGAQNRLLCALESTKP